MSTSDTSSDIKLEQIISLCKRRGFVFQTAEIYGGLNGVYDIGALGTLLKQNIRSAWQRSLNMLDYDILPIEGSILSPYSVWQASGHLSSFQDPLVDCLTCKKRFRADDVNLEKACPACGNISWTDVREFNLMFKTHLGASLDQASEAYLRPETAQSIFFNFKNITSTYRVKVPFGISQIGKAFRNEITPKQFLFRMREFEQMELEWFCTPDSKDKYFEFWCNQRLKFYKDLNINQNNIRLRKHEKDELSHYSSKTSDIEYKFPFGWKELEGIADRGNYDLTQHKESSGKDLSIYDADKQESYLPHVIECSVGADRLFLMVLFDAYTQEVIENTKKKEERTVLKLHPLLSPYKAAILPLTKHQKEETHKLYTKLKKTLLCKSSNYHIQFDHTGSIGKRYRRQDEIGTPLCFTYDFESAEDNCVTVRHRDSMKQERISIDSIEQYIQKYIEDPIAECV